MYIVSKLLLFLRNLLRLSTMQITLCLLLFLLQIPVAYLQNTTIDFTINSICGSISPVYDTSYKLLANDRFCVGFSSLFQNKIVFGIFANWQGDAQMIWYADVPDPVELGSRLLFNPNKVLVLQPRDSNQTVWAANAANVTSWKLTDIGTFVLYDGQNNSIWQSMDYLTDTLFMGQSFTSTSEIMKVSDYRLAFAAYDCKIEFSDPNLGWKPQLQSTSTGDVFLSFNNSAVLFSFTFWTYEDGRDLSNAFIRLHPQEISIYTLLNGKWDVQLISFNTLTSKNPQVTVDINTCGPVHWSRELLSSLERVLCGLLILLLFSECLFLFIGALTAYSKILLLIIATIPPSSIAVALMISQQYLMPNKFHTPYAIHAIILTIIMLHVVNIILCWIIYARALSNLTVRNNFIGLLLINMLSLLSAHLGAYFFRSLSTNDLNVKKLGYFFIPGLLSHTNTICLIVETLPGRKWFGSDARIIMVIISNISIGAISGFQIYWNSVHPYQYLHNHIIWVCLLAANGILILLSLWGCYAHDLMTGRSVVSARLSSLKTWCGRQRKRIVVWLVSCLVGRSKPLKDPEDDITMSLSYFRYEELEVVTDGFSRLLGQGGFGGVYNGTLLSGRKVAVKKLESASQGNKEFKAEIRILGRVHHLNLASLLGFCAEGPNRLLVYDLMANGSLDKWIFEDGPFLDWPTRLNILVGTARGLAYLHEECDPRIIHLDVKPQNILLDESFGAKVSDFGLCMFLSKDESSLILTRMMGTMGYLAPERIQGLVTEKSDVYSFGIVMLEVISGNRGYKSLELEENFQPFRTWAIQRMRENSLIDPRLRHCVNEAESKRIIEVALWCTRYDPNKRPSMGNVVKMLEGSAEIPYCTWTEEITLFSIDEAGE